MHFGNLYVCIKCKKNVVHVKHHKHPPGKKDNKISILVLWYIKCLVNLPALEKVKCTTILKF